MIRHKQFFLKSAIFLLLAIGLNAAFHLAYNHWMYYFRLARNQDRQFEAFDDTLKYLMLGNSHNRINPEVMGHAFCYITPKELYKQTYYKLRYIVEKSGKIPQYVLLSIDPLNFSPRAANELPFDGYWRKYLDYGELICENRDPGYLQDWLEGNFFSYVGNYKYAYMSIQFFNYDFSLIKNGYFPPRNYKNFAREPNREVLGYEIASAYLAGFTRNSGLGDTRYYVKILELCRIHDIKLILLRMPMTDEYLKYARKLIDLERLDREIIDLTRSHYDKFRLFDFRDRFKGQPDFFFNADHVNPAGAAIISREIKSAIENRE